ncbi:MULTISPECIES: amino acid ABC transporter ATP-binding protein [Fructobacillus]|jgi:polar amino acid transport system ATP-binding protein|uniref:ATPase component (GlnQ) n=1 Tax=Fructobacillus cardui TaxID=2893170 RepID=A0ABN9Z3T9_9LACO|nr:MULTISPECIES: ATP-binding cassette domain-containing protein [Fructobacillus]KMK53514.1 Glutamine transport ATP-binding protein GlnQ [Fructobacillus sp. EFB-N1]MCK8627433.1 ATP-binding cassette domain-containing protein [Fructobacillus cardui]CAK1233903.1 ABC-type polar amino acid transport system [Fructobacillus cardui]CAK1241057.1 ABC-type polar amino acid transport system [Fructobacillus cardui]CAK1253086.1 ABC-type polar amino acid transport system [Fructobacillus cardui]
MIAIKNLTKAYGDNVIFKDLSLTMADGEILVVVGPSGSGKTTFIKTLTGLEDASAGEIDLNGQAYQVGDSALAAKIGLIFQDFNLFPHLTVKKNLTLAPMTVKKMSEKEANQKADELLSTLGLTDQANLYPYQLSGGQKQRVGIARALAMDPQIIAYDEPTSGLDEKTTDQVSQVMLALKKAGVTQLVVTHDLPFADKVADTVFDFEKEVQR